MRRPKLTTIYWGLILILLGAIFLARNLGFLDFWFSLRDYWPVVLIVLGLAWIIGGLESGASQKDKSQ